MREFVYFSRRAVTTGNFDDLMKAGRMDIVTHIIVTSFFLSNKERESVKLNLFFYGPPNPPKRLEIISDENGLDVSISKKDMIGLIKRMLYKGAKAKERKEVFPNCYVSSQSVLDYLKELKKEDRNIYLLDERGDNIRNISIGENPVFFLGDHEGYPTDEKRRIKKNGTMISLGPETYFASQSMTILQNELDIRGI